MRSWGWDSCLFAQKFPAVKTPLQAVTFEEMAEVGSTATTLVSRRDLNPYFSVSDGMESAFEAAASTRQAASLERGCGQGLLMWVGVHGYFSSWKEKAPRPKGKLRKIE